MSQAIELDDFEALILGYALAHGKVEPGSLGSQIQQLLLDKGQSSSNYYDVFQKTSARLQKRGLADEHNRPTAHAIEVVPSQLLRNAIHRAHRSLDELESELKRKDAELSQLKNMSPGPNSLSRDALAQGLWRFLEWEVVNRLSEGAKKDLEDAVKCLYHGIATPAVMVSLRSSEDVVRRYYSFKTGQGWESISWDGMLKELSKLEGVKQTLLGNLDYIREKRNLADHPGKVFNAMEAEEIFNIVKVAIRDMYSEIPKAT